MADPPGLINRYNAIRKLETGEHTQDGKTARVHFVNYYTSSTGRSKDPLKPAPAAVHPGRSFGLADAEVLDTGSSTLEEMTREIHLEVDPRTPKLHARNLSTMTISPGGGAMTHLDPDPVSDNVASYEMQDKQRSSSPAHSRNPNGKV